METSPNPINSPISAKSKKNKDCLLKCINKVLAGQFLKTLMARTDRYESFDASPAVQPCFDSNIESFFSPGCKPPSKNIEISQ